MTFIGQDGTKYVFKAKEVEIVVSGKQIFVNDTLVAEYLNADDAREAAESIKEELDSSAEEYILPVKHFQAEPFVKYAWASESIYEFLYAVRKLPHEFINEFFHCYKSDGLEEACDTAKKITEYACIYDNELTEQDSNGATVVIGEGDDEHEGD